jgi:hemolysin III
MSRYLWLIPKDVPSELRTQIKTIPEEVANMLSHGVGLVFFLIAVPLLWLRLEFSYGAIAFGLTLLMVYFSSTLYHSVYKPVLKRRLRVVDHISIYFLIAGSFTPFILTHLQTTPGWWVLGVLWVMVLIGSVFKYFFTHRFNAVATFAYVGMAGMVLFVIAPLSRNLPDVSLNWLIAGGVAYLAGVPFYLWKSLYMNHLIWHIFVLAGSISHYLAVWHFR